MAPSKGAPQQHRQPSRKSKRAWRKNVDITEVQNGLESLREEIIQGGPVAEKPSEELFVLDTTGSEEIKRRHKLQKPLMVDQILARRSAVPAVDSRKRSLLRVTDGVIEPSSKRQRTDWVSKKEVQRLKDGLDSRSHLNTDRLEDDGGTDFDLWAVSRAVPTEVTSVDEYIPKPRSKVAPKTITHPPIAMTASGKAVRAVRNPDAATSYNPMFEDWDELLNREGQKEVEAEKIRLEKEQIEAERQARIEAAGAAEEGGNRTDDESAWEGFETDNEDPEALKRKRPERKTPAQRNKIKRRKEAERLASHMKATTKKQKQIELAMIQSTLADRDGGELINLDVNNIGGKSDSSDDNDDDTKLRRRRIGNAPIPEKALEVVLPDELQDSLRRLKPEGNLMNDRFRTLLVNGKIESRKPILHPKKKKRTFTEKWTYKDFSIQV